MIGPERLLVLGTFRGQGEISPPPAYRLHSPTLFQDDAKNILQHYALAEPRNRSNRLHSPQLTSASKARES